MRKKEQYSKIKGKYERSAVINVKFTPSLFFYHLFSTPITVFSFVNAIQLFFQTENICIWS